MLQSIPDELSRDACLAESWKQTSETAGPLISFSSMLRDASPGYMLTLPGAMNTRPCVSEAPEALGGRRDAEDQGSSKAEGSLQIEGRQPLVSMLKKGKNIHEDLSARTLS
ncbi:unnamed protein product [Gadus morhua 'NCC']